MRTNIIAAGEYLREFRAVPGRPAHGPEDLDSRVHDLSLHKMVAVFTRYVPKWLSGL
jgi:hypothetical protein